MERLRFSKAPWFEEASSLTSLVVGQGGIASWLTLLLARLGGNITTYDGDVIEDHNQAGQLFKTSQIGVNKALAVQRIVKEFTGEDNITVYPTMFKEDSMINPVVLTGLDNMKARELVFKKWFEFLKDNKEYRSKAILIDGRLNAELFQIYCVQGDNPEQIRKYKEEALFPDEEAFEPLCSFKQTSHCAAMIASYMVSFLVNWLGKESEDFRHVPFFYEMNLPLLLTDQN